jgi:serine/threonine-protein kinase RsbW
LNKIFRLNCRARLGTLAEIREFVASSSAALGLGNEAVEDLKVCVDEAATNIIKYGYGDDEGDVAVEVSRVGDEILVRMVDEATPFDPGLVPPPDLERPLSERPIGGMGVHLIRTLSDGVSHKAAPAGGNELLLRKRIAD